MFITTAKVHAETPYPIFYIGLHLICSMWKICDHENLLQLPLQEIRLNAFLWLTNLQIQSITII